MAMILESAAFRDNGLIPKKYTCDGENLSPPLAWSGVPMGARWFVLICDDPDAPGGTFVHWLLYNIPASVRSLPEGPLSAEAAGTGALGGVNDFGEADYGGPCPPSGTHHYSFRVYALKDKLALNAGVDKKELEQAMRPYILDYAQLIGRYARM